jgi:hypothetical protein
MLHRIARRKYGKPRIDMDPEDIRRILAKNDTDGNVSLDKQEFYDLYKQL